MKALALLVPLAALHLYFALCLTRLMAALAIRPGVLPWIPLANLGVPFRLAGRSPAWAAALALPAANVVVWALAWQEIARRRGLIGPWGLLLAIPIVNIVALARLCGLRRAQGAAALAALVSAGAAGLGLTEAAERRAVARGLARLRSGTTEERLGAVRAPGVGDRAALAGLASALRDPDPRVRAEAAAGFARVG